MRRPPCLAVSLKLIEEKKCLCFLILVQDGDGDAGGYVSDAEPGQSQQPQLHERCEVPRVLRALLQGPHPDRGGARDHQRHTQVRVDRQNNAGLYLRRRRNKRKMGRGC